MPGKKNAVATESPSDDVQEGYDSAARDTQSGQSAVRRSSRSDWESAVMRRLAPRVAELEEQARSGEDEERYGWESAGLRHLSSRLSAME